MEIEAAGLERMDGDEVAVHVQLHACAGADVRTGLAGEAVEELRRNAAGFAYEDAAAA